MGRVEGKVAFITGAARGQGRSHAVRLAQEGADIIATDTTTTIGSVPYPLSTAEDLAETVRLVEATGRRIVAREADVRDPAALRAAVDAGIAEFGRLDIVVANAGIVGFGPALEIDDEAWQDMVDVNLTGSWRTLKAAVPHIVAGGRGGAVVVTSSTLAMQAFEHTAHYAATKAGLVMLTKVMAKELAGHRIRVNTVNPTTVATPMVLNDAVYRLFRPDLDAPTRDDFEDAARQLNRLPVAVIDPADVTEVVLHLVADSGRYITGTTQLIDAGSGL